VGTQGKRGNLPAEWTSFVGRRSEAAAVRKALSTSRLVTLTGAGGVGKTRLALRVADTMRRTFSDGAWLVELGGVNDRLLVAQVVSDALGIVDQTARDEVQVLNEFVAPRQMLLVMDTCEHLVPAVATLVVGLLRGAPGLRVLATSREALGVIGEHIVDVAPLPVPGRNEPVTLASALRYPALALFAERAAAAAPGFEITDGNVGLVAQVCRQLDGVALAIELAAARMHGLALEQVVTRLDDRFALLRAGRVGTPRHQTVQAAVEWSFDLCAKPERLLWLRASVFAGSFDLAGVERVCCGDGLPVDIALETLAGLVNRSVLITEDDPAGRRYRMLDTIREYARDRLRHPHLDDYAVMDEEALRVRHRDHYLELAERFDADWFGPRQVPWSQRMHAEQENVRAALGYCLNTVGHEPAGLRLAGALYYLWFGCGEIREGRYWLERALAVDLEPGPERARALVACGQLVLLQGDTAGAAGRARQALELARRFDDRYDEVEALRILGTSLLFSGDSVAGGRLLQQSVARADEISNAHPVLAATGTLVLGMDRMLAGDNTRAVALFAQTIAMCRTHGDQWLLSITLSASVLVALAAGDVAQAVEYAREGLRGSRALDDLQGVQTALEHLAWSAAAARDYRRAARLLGAVTRQWYDLGGSPFAGPFAERHERCVSTTRDALGDEAYDAEHQRGHELTLDEAVVFALGEEPAPVPRKAAGPGATLTPREREIAELVAHGMSNRQIAERLVISQRTAESHVENILSKLGFTTRTEIAVWHTRQSEQTASEG